MVLPLIWLIMKHKNRQCHKCKQAIPHEAKFCPFCGIHLSHEGTKDYTKCSYTELMLEAKRFEVSILKDERNIEKLRKEIEDGTLKLKTTKKLSGAGRAEIIEARRCARTSPATRGWQASRVCLRLRKLLG